ncbi:hypothetical protein TNIN_133971 [Trichonephila inaurata madagascariensis]|uniref:Uncharacterized protein n=1 Tax=Trichonephila inaurata madagascariensis TaxID=2747483 RepID=A0A8X6Y9B9_9ARAC|nr:hypothetical protein TNIN_133971 [Trichonephila inaurata madagascariensis]
MLVRLPRAPVLSGGLRRKTRLFSGIIYMAASSKTQPHQSKVPWKFKTSLQVPVFPWSSLLCRHDSCEKPSDSTSFHSVLVCHRTSSQVKLKIICKEKINNKARPTKEINHKMKCLDMYS